jgi:2-polyprenyl-6-methoxyphenol hydroxylase-like FAD-dependent oxidoreductase
MYDAIVVGARCAGSPTAMLLARKGYRVLLVDKATFPSDTMSAHFIRIPGIAHLKQWGVLDKIIASKCPPIATMTLDFGQFALHGMSPSVEGVAAAYAPRRTVLDKILVDAAVEAGVEVREGFFVEEILRNGDRVTGVQGRHQGGRSVKEQARLVIGADGMRSLVARSVQAATYQAEPSLTCAYYGYWSGVPLEGAGIYVRPGRMFITFPTNENLTCIYVAWPRSEFHAFRADIEGNFLKTLDPVPHFAERVRQSKQVERFVGTADLPNFFRKPYGPGWVLVGDAGFHKDPCSAQGITDAFRDVELVVEAIDAGFSERLPLEEALASYERQRNEMALPLYESNIQAASMKPSPPEMQQLFAALQGNQEQTNRFFGIHEGTTSASEFFSPENMQRIMAAAGVGAAPTKHTDQERNTSLA